MIIRKPYAFLIKYFRKIHIALMIIGVYVFYKTIRAIGFISTYFQSRVYDAYENPIVHYIPTFLKISTLAMAVGSIAILVLLMHKGKPWKLYLVPAGTYIILYFILGIVQGFFSVYTETINISDLKLVNDFLVISLLAQLPSMAIFAIRIMGVDIKGFNFRQDLDELELTDEDREEIELGLNIDIYTFIRFGRKCKRYAGYFYEEHKKLCKLAAIVIVIFLLKGMFNFIFVENKTYSQGEVYSIDGYEIKVTNAYWTDKDKKGNVISQTSNFVIVEYEVKNNVGSRNLNTSNFHIKAGNKDYTTTETTYANDFDDLGRAYSRVKKIKKDETAKFIIIYKVAKKYSKGRFALYYQERNGSYKLRKMSLKIKNVSKMEKEKTYQQGEFFDIETYSLKDSIAFDEFKIVDSAGYRVSECSFNECYTERKVINAPNGYKIMSIDFASDDIEAKNMIDFLDKYGKIEYKDSSGKVKTLDSITFMLKKNYLGKTLYIKLPSNIAESDYIAIKIIIRNKAYKCLLT